MMAAQLRGGDGETGGIGQALKEGLSYNTEALKNNTVIPEGQTPKEKVVLVNKAGESRSPYVSAHAENPVAWQLWGDDAIALARKENRLLFISIGYSACHWCHVMERESFENDEVAAILNDEFIPIKIDREERPDIDRIYLNFVQATTGSGGWPLNVFLTPQLQPVFGGTYWPGPTNSGTSVEDRVDFLGVLNKLSTAWKEQEERCRLDSGQILQQLMDFAQEGTLGDRLGEGGDAMDIELLEEANQHFKSTYDATNGGFGSTPKFPTPSKLSFLLRLGQYPQVVVDLVGQHDCRNAENMAVSTLRKMARGGIHDHIGHGFSRYSVTADWSLPHFEKMLYDNAQLLDIYLDGFLLSRDPELLGVVYDICTYLTTTLAHPEGGFYSSEDADSFYKKGDSEKREGAFYIWTKREFENVLGAQAEPILSTFFNVSGHGNVSAENDAHDEFIDQNVLAIASTPSTLASTYGMKEDEVVKIIKDGKAALLAHRDKDRVRPALDDKLIVGWNGIALGALARTAAVIKGFDPDKSETYLAAALKAATIIKKNLYDESEKILYRIWREGRGDTPGFADDYAFLIEGLIDLYEATFDEAWLHWADDLQQSQISLFYDTTGSGAFFSTPFHSPHTILRLKDGMDASEPSTNGTSSSNLYRLSSLLNDDTYAKKAKETIHSFESEIMQYPWLFASFMPGVVAGHLGVKGVVVAGEGIASERITAFERAPRGGLGSFARVHASGSEWLRERNGLLGEFGKDGEARVLVCEGGVCREERVVKIERPSKEEVKALGKGADEGVAMSVGFDNKKGEGGVGKLEAPVEEMKELGVEDGQIHR
ncbi:hypothetical protein BJ875DRAFT_131737 [Amylocarpus encephaloides]|uniref:Spermatogenesis-associated protein 20-like TRX domain-containing protein n=1 Tax=Amylocarpus encephaloides TaxID=45428 RepID=A0A9P7YQ43_9HELO|nr:hypothetical protein BJ875DRAFT_131737 [Amylocarpus encephaloides]